MWFTRDLISWVITNKRARLSTFGQRRLCTYHPWILHTWRYAKQTSLCFWIKSWGVYFHLLRWGGERCNTYVLARRSSWTVLVFVKSTIGQCKRGFVTNSDSGPPLISRVEGHFSAWNEKPILVRQDLQHKSLKSLIEWTNREDDKSYARLAWALAKALARTLARAQAQTQVLAQAARALA